VRVNFNYFISEAVFEYVLEAVHLVAEAGWKLLPYYRFSVNSGLWRHRDHHHSKEFGLDDVKFRSGRLTYEAQRLTEPESALTRYLNEASRIIDQAEAEFGSDEKSATLPEELERLRWFPLPNAPFLTVLRDADTPEDTDS
jgi:hypothetical protein